MAEADYKEMDDERLVQIIAEKINRALNRSDGEISERRQDMLDLYMGARTGRERRGYSRFVTREVMEAVEWAMPTLVRIFTAGKKIVTFDPVGLEDEAEAEQETDVVNHVVMKANNGFLALYTFIKDCLINPTAYARVDVETEARTIVRRMHGLTPQALSRLMARDNVEIIEQDSEVVQVEVETPQGPDLVDVEVFNVRYRQYLDKPYLVIEPTPGEEALVDDDFTGQDLDDAMFLAHRSKKDKSTLMRMGFAEDDLEGLGTGGLDDDASYNDEKEHRAFFEDESAGDDEDDEPDDALRPYWCHDVYLWVDYNGDGEAEYRKVFLVGNRVFENEECDYQPMVAGSASIIPHRHTGLSLAEMVAELQELLTTLMRQLLDNTYSTNVKRKFVSEASLAEDGSTLEALMDPLAEYVLVVGDPRAAVYPEQPQSILDSLLPVIQHAQQSVPMRTGVAPENNVDPDVLQQTTVGAFMGAMEKAGERIELIARVLAETGIKQLFRKVHELCRMYPDIATTVKLRGEWVDVDPTAWIERTDLTTNVGLGFNDKRHLVEMFANLLAIQKEMAPEGLATPQHIYNTLEKLVEAGDIGAVEEFFISPNSPEFQPPEPPPPDQQQELYKAQAEAVLQEQARKRDELEGRREMDDRKMALEEAKAMSSLEDDDEAGLALENTEADIELKRARAIEALVKAGKTAEEAIAIMRGLDNDRDDTGAGGADA